MMIFILQYHVFVYQMSQMTQDQATVFDHGRHALSLPSAVRLMFTLQCGGNMRPEEVPAPCSESTAGSAPLGILRWRVSICLRYLFGIMRWKYSCTLSLLRIVIINILIILLVSSSITLKSNTIIRKSGYLLPG